MPRHTTRQETAGVAAPESSGLHAELWHYIELLEGELCIPPRAFDLAALPVQSKPDHEPMIYRHLRDSAANHGHSVVEFDASTADGEFLLRMGYDGVARQNGEIYVRADLSYPDKIGVLLHEYTHQILHVGQDRPGPYLAHMARYECQAEGVSFVVSAFLGIYQRLSAADLVATLEDRDLALRVLQTEAGQIVQTSADLIGDLCATKDNNLV